MRTRKPPLKVVIAEDEPTARLFLSRLLKRAGCEVQAEFEEGNSLLAWIESNPLPDALFLDVLMPGPTGIEILAQLGGKLPTVLVTGYPEYAVPAFEHEAVDFLVKPVQAQRLARTLTRLKKWNKQKEGRPVPSETTSTLRFPVRAGKGMILLETRMVSHFELVEGKVLAFASGTSFCTQWSSITEVERALWGLDLVRINRTVLVRPEAVKGMKVLSNGRRMVHLGEKLERIASRQGTHDLLDKLRLP